MIARQHIWRRISAAVVTLTTLVCLSGCGGFQTFKSYEGPERPDDKLAVITCGTDVRGDTVVIKDAATGTEVYNGKRFRVSCFAVGNKITVEPASYEIFFQACGYKAGCAYLHDTVALEAGHSYWIGGDKCYMFCFSVESYVEYVWIEDETAGKVIAGHAI